MRAGELRHRVLLQVASFETDPIKGYRTPVWANVEAKPLPAAIAPLSGREFVAAAATQSSVSTRITIRYMAGITNQHRLVQVGTGTIYNIEGLLPDHRSGREWLTLMCSTGMNDG